jgi:hypothetical protein
MGSDRARQSTSHRAQVLVEPQLAGRAAHAFTPALEILDPPLAVAVEVRETTVELDLRVDVLRDVATPRSAGRLRI